MKNKNDFEKIIERYLKEDDTDYGYMLSANWGCGKTFYIKHNFLEQDFLNNYKRVYYSLNGITSFENASNTVNLSILSNKGEVDKETENTIKKVTSTISKRFNKSSNTVLNVASNIVSSFSNEILNTCIKDKLQQTFIVFDDLERISNKIQLTDLLGDIFEKYIARGAKVLFICDESKIENEKDKYLKEKEKYIRRTISFEPDKESVFKNLLSQVSFYKDSSEKDKTYYLESFLFYYKNTTQPNFRNINFILDIFEEVYDKYKIVSKKKKQIFELHQLFYQTVVLSNLYKNGYTKEKNLTDSQYYTYLAREKKNIREDPYYNARLQSENGPGSCGRILQSIVNLIFYGKFNEEQFDEDIYKDEDSLLKKLSSYKLLENDELCNLLKSILDGLKEKKYTMYDYSLLVKSFLPLALKYLTEVTEKQIKDLIFESLKNSIPPEYLEFYSKQSDIGTERIFFSEIPELQEYINQEINIHNSNEIDTFINNLSNDKDVVYSKIKSSYLFLEAILKDSTNYEKILNQKNKGITLFTYLINSEILGISNYGEYHKDLIPHLQKFSVAISAYISNPETDSLKKEVLEELQENVKKAIEHISSWKK